VHPRLLDVLHDGADDGDLAVAYRVNVHLHRILQELVDQDGPLRRGLDCGAHEVLEFSAVIDQLHRPAAEHERRAHEDRVTDLVGQLQRPFVGGRGAVRGLLQTEPVEQILEMLSVLRYLDAAGACAQQRHVVRLKLG